MTVIPPTARHVVITLGPWRRRWEVAVEPPAVAHPLRSFRTYADALEHAHALGREHGWAIVDQTTDDDGPRAA